MTRVFTFLPPCSSPSPLSPNLTVLLKSRSLSHSHSYIFFSYALCLNLLQFCSTMLDGRDYKWPMKWKAINLGHSIRIKYNFRWFFSIERFSNVVVIGRSFRIFLLNTAGKKQQTSKNNYLHMDFIIISWDFDYTNRPHANIIIPLQNNGIHVYVTLSNKERQAKILWGKNVAREWILWLDKPNQIWSLCKHKEEKHIQCIYI